MILHIIKTLIIFKINFTYQGINLRGIVWRKILTVCPYCGAGCQLYLVVKDNKILRAEPANGRTNQESLCLKGRYGWDFLNDPKILTPRLKSQ